MGSRRRTDSTTRAAGSDRALLRAGGRAIARALRPLPRRRRRGGGSTARGLRPATGARGRAPPRGRRGDAHRGGAKRGRRLGIAVAITNDTHTHARARQPLQDVLTCVRLGTTVEKVGRRLFPNAERTLKGAEEMARLWPDFPEGLENTIAIAEACRFRLDEIRGEHPLPPVLALPHEVRPSSIGSTAVPAPAGNKQPHDGTPSAISTPYPDPLPRRGEGGRPSLSTSTRRDPDPDHEPDRDPPVTGMPLLRALVEDGARWRWKGEPPEDVRRQMEKELELVEQLGYASYFLTVWDIVALRARARHPLPGPRAAPPTAPSATASASPPSTPRGSSLLFERFISVERGEPPDIDVDFEHERREEVLQYVYERYGRDRAGMVCEVISYRGKSALRDVGRRSGSPSSRWTGSRSSSTLRGRRDMTPERARAGRPRPDRLARGAPDARPRPRARRASRATSPSTWAASSSPPAAAASRRPSSRRRCRAAPSSSGTRTTSTSSGFFKVDVLGARHAHRASASARLAAPRRSITRRRRSPPPTPSPPTLAAIPAEDPAVYEVICRADTIGVFQIESRAQMSLLPRLKPGASMISSSRWRSSAPARSRAAWCTPTCGAATGDEPCGMPHAPLRPGPGEDARRPALPGAGDAHRGGRCWLHAG